MPKRLYRRKLLWRAKVVATSGAPAWVPAGSTTHIDFLGNRAWDGNQVAVNTQVGSDPVSETGWGNPTSYVPAELTVDGYAPTAMFAFIGATRTAIIAGATVRIEFKNILPSHTVLFMLLSQNGVTGLDVNLMLDGTAKLASWSGAGEVVTPGVVKIVTAGAINAIAFTTTSTRFEGAVNGSTALNLAITTADYPTSGSDMLVCAVIDGMAPHAIRTINVRPPIAIGGLPALSVPT